jgi:nickel/cobalt transporter (NicO) family protein
VRRLLVVFLALAALALPAAASAHPLGNFTVNRFAAVELAGDRVYVHYVLDLAEIPTLQEGDAVRRAGFAERIAGRLELRLDGSAAALRLLDHDVRSRPGAGGLATLRFEAVYEAARTGRQLSFRDGNYRDRIGWKEIVVRARDGARLLGSDVPSASTSGELLDYPEARLQSPPDVSSASARLVPGAAAGSPPELSGRAPAPSETGGFESLVSTELGAGAIALALLVAAFWGAAHALTPGHGKAIVAGYLVGSRGTPRHAVLLGLIVTATHTAGVFALGLVTLLLSRFVVPERLYPWLTVASGLLVVGVGVSVLRSRLRHRRAHAHGQGHHHHDHEHGDLTRRGLVGIGVAAGLLPCPSALVVLLSAIALHRVGLGLALIVAFSVGLAATITGVGLVAVLARRAFSRLRLDGPVVRALPSLSAVVIVAVGIGLTARALPEVF